MKKLYFNGKIVTMTEKGTAGYLLTSGGRIEAVGEIARELAKNYGSAAEHIDLDGKTVLPGFVDAHGHLSSLAASMLEVSLGGSRDHGELADRIRRFIAENAVKPGEWVIAGGYDDNFLAENRHPPKELLDGCAPENPIVIKHVSGHVGVLSSAALKSLGITEKTPVPDGGKIEKANGRLTGYMEETAFFDALRKVPQHDEDKMLRAYSAAQAKYASYGITTINEGMFVPEMMPMFRKLTEKGLLYLDTAAFAGIDDAADICEAFPESVRRYDRHLKIGGCKIFLDGSPQGRTAWMTEPYENGDPSYCGYPVMSDAEVTDAAAVSANLGLQLLAHCNGDAAARQFLSCLAKSADIGKLRPVMIHAQFAGEGELDEMKRLGVMPSFFVAHVYHWGDEHIVNFGLHRASRISPAASALARGIKFTFHQDAPVIAPDMLETVWCAVNRVTEKGNLLGAEERISVYDALKAVTVNAAYQNFEENEKGTIEPGKAADLVILEDDPLSVAPQKIRYIRVSETVKGGESVYRR